MKLDNKNEFADIVQAQWTYMQFIFKQGTHLVLEQN
jgi:hypothetical protein